MNISYKPNNNFCDWSGAWNTWGSLHLAVYGTTDVSLGAAATSPKVRYLRIGSGDK